MASVHWARVSGAVACLTLVSWVVEVAAAPWMGPGDVRARHALQKLADRGHLNRTVTTWPFMLDGLESGLDQNGSAQESDAVGAGLAYLQFEQSKLADPGPKMTATASATSEPVFVRGFNAEPREAGELELKLEYVGESFAAAIVPGYVANPEDDEDLRLDGSYLAFTALDWVLGVGAIDRWWGPGWQSSMVLSTNARPLPAVWLNRRTEAPFESDWLSWIGAWQFTAFLGQMEQERYVPDAKLVGMRLTVRPVQGMDIGFSRIIQFGGEGRPEGLSTFWDAFLGRDNGQLGTEDEPGNQLGTIDVRYGFGLGKQSVGLYVQVTGEDEAGAFPSRKSWLFGTDWTTQWGASDQQWFIEAMDSIADDLTGDARYNTAYEHFIYQSGYRYYGRMMAPAFESDARAVTLGVFNFLPDGRNLGLTVSYADLNGDGIVRAEQPDASIQYQVPTDAQKVATANLSYGQELLGGWLKLNTQIADKEIELTSGTKNKWSVGAEWTYRF